jgi:hypothetical protein
MLKRFLLITAVCSLLAVAIPFSASAHVFRTDGTTTVELHIPPTDHPLSGETTRFRLEFEDAASKFKLQDCNCSVTITQDSATIATHHISRTDEANTGEVTHNFASAGNYTLHVSGQPKQNGQFTPFAVQYPVRIEQGEKHAGSFPVWAIAVIASGVAVIIVAAIVMERSDRKKPDGGSPNLS